MNLKFSKQWSWYLVIVCLSGGCSHEVSREEAMVLQLFNHLDSCSSLEWFYVPPPPPLPPNRLINLAEVSCLELTTDKDLFYYKEEKADSIRRITNCFLLLDDKRFDVEGIPHINDTCYWRPETCNTKKGANFLEQYLFLNRNTSATWELVSESMSIYDKSRSAYHWYCKYVPFPCVDSSFLSEIKGEVIKMLCFHDYTHCYLIGTDSIPKYINQKQIK